MNKTRPFTIICVIILSLALSGMAMAGDTPPQATGSRSGIPDTTPPVVYLSPASFSQGFDDVNNLPDWYIQNNCEPLGTLSWYQGVNTVFPAQAGAPTAYIAANYNATAGTGTISDWLLTPELVLGNGATFSFWTRTATASAYPDRLQLRLSLSGPSTNVGTGAEDTGDFTRLLLDINPTLEVGGYPEVWTHFMFTLTGIPAGSSGRFAFRYYVTDGGPSGVNSNYIGVDTVEFTTAPVDIVVTPQSLHAAQATNKITTQQLQVCNAGTTDLSWTLSEVPANQVGVILLIETGYVPYSVQSVLNELGYPFNLFKGVDWTSLNFTPYNVVIVAMDGGFIDPPSLLKVRTDVIDAGKRLIFLGGTSIDSFALGVNQYLVLNDIANNDWKISSTPHFTVVDPAHPLAHGLTSPYNFIDNMAAYYMLRVTDPNIEAVAENGDGYTNFFYKGANFPLIQGGVPQAVGDFIWFINSPFEGYWTNPGDFTLLKQVLSNAIGSNLVLDNLWLSERPIYTTIPVGETAEAMGVPVDQDGSTLSMSFTDEPSQGVPEGLTTSSNTSHIGLPTNSANPEAVLLDQPLSTVWQAAYTDQEFPDFPTFSAFLADDFINTDPWSINTIFIPGDGWNGFSTLLNATALTWHIYADDGGVPAGDPSGGGDPPLWSLTLAPTDPQVTITAGTPGGMPSNTQLTLIPPINLEPGHYWLIFYPTMNFGLYGQYGRQPADTTNGYTGQLINPGGGFGYGTVWQPWTVLGPTQTDIAFRLEGEIGVGIDIPWLSENPMDGTTPGGECTIVNINFNSFGLMLGDYFGALRFESNDPYKPFLNVPVTLTVNQGNFYLPLTQRR